MTGKPFGSPADATAEIQKITAYEDRSAKQHLDMSADDSAVLFRRYFHYRRVSVHHDVTLKQLKQTVAAGNLVIVPTNGQKMGNPYYRRPGPERHMVVIYGFDPDRSEFVTNDPGTRHGAGSRYKADVLYEAMRDYSTGFHIPILEIRKTMIVVRPPITSRVTHLYGSH